MLLHFVSSQRFIIIGNFLKLIGLSLKWTASFYKYVSDESIWSIFFDCLMEGCTFWGGLSPRADRIKRYKLILEWLNLGYYIDKDLSCE